MILGKDNRKRWSFDDLLLSQAYVVALEIIKSEECSQCGYPKYICHSSDSRIRLDLDEDFCQVKYQIEERQSHDRKMSQKGDDDGRSMWGSQLHPRVDFLPGMDVTAARELWQKEQQRIEAARKGIILDDD